jgi:peptide/nickel transport system permease protein
MIHLALPVAALTMILTAHIARQTRSEMVDVLHADFVRTAVLKGLPQRVVLFRHALRNALLPTVTVIALDVGYLIGGILVVEEVFAYPGIGRLMLFSIQNRDLPMIQAGALVLASTYALANLMADLAYAWLDPRIRYA